MTIILWFLLTAAVYAALFAVGIPIRRREMVSLCLILIAAEVMFACACAYVTIASSRLFPRYLLCALGVLYTALFADAATEFLLLIIRIIRKGSEKGVVRFFAGMAATFLFLGYMVINSQTVTPLYHTYTSGKLMNNHRFVFLSDLHYGHTQSRETVEKTLEKIKSEDPEFLLLGGDITDEFTSREDMEYIYERIGSLDIPTYYIYGNHDRQNHSEDVGSITYSANQLETAITNNGIHILSDEFVVLDDIVILGREDYESNRRVQTEKLSPRPEGKYVINLDHSPYLYSDIASTGADLQLSGHVHAGQLFPLRWIYHFEVQNIYGEYRVGNTDLYVSSGISGWCFPLRSEEHCHYEVIDLIKEES